MYAFRVYGRPATKGSGFAVVNGRALPKHGKAIKEWESLVRAACFELLPDQPFDDPCKVYLLFYLYKPKRPRHFLPINRPDIDKLARAVIDGLQQTKDQRGFMVEDSQVVSLEATKRYATEDEPEGCMVRIVPWRV